MLDPKNRFATAVLAVGTIVLLIAIAIGERMGDRVLGQATDRTLQSVAPVLASPEPSASSGPYGPDWKRSETLAAAPDPHFPDPRVPPQPLPTPLPATAAPAAPQTPTPNPNIPIWRQQGMPSPTPDTAATDEPSGSPSPSASPGTVTSSVTPP